MMSADETSGAPKSAHPTGGGPAGEAPAPGRLAEAARARAALAAIGAGNPALEADLLLAEAARISRLALYRDDDRPLESAEKARFDALLARRLSRAPLQYVLGRTEFFGLELETPEGVFIPRPETETLVEAALDYLEGMSEARFADIGTGSGAVALAVLARAKTAHALATDLSPLAVATACRNAEALGLAGRFTAKSGDLLTPFEPLAAPLDAVLSNPPYIRDADIATLSPEIRDHEPRAALAGGEDGLDAIRRLLAGAVGWLRRKGVLAFEIGYHQREGASALVGSTPGLRLETVREDLGGRSRVVIVTRT